MPKIPLLERTRSLPGSAGGALISPALASAEAKARAEAGKGLAVVGSQAMRIAGAIALRDKRREDLVAAAKIESAMRNDINEFQHTFDVETDQAGLESENILPAIERFKTSSLPKYLEMAKDNPDVAASAEKAFAAQGTALTAWGRGKKREIELRVGRGEWDKLYNADVDAWVLAQTQEERKAIKEGFELRAALFTQAGILTPSEEETFLQQFDDRAYGAYFRWLMDSDVERAVEELGNREFLPGLDLTKRAILLKEAKAKLKMVKAGEEAAWETHVYRQLVSFTNGNPEAMLEILADPTSHEEYKIDLAAVKRIGDMVQRKAVIDRARMDRIGTDYRKKVVVEEITPTQAVAGILEEIRKHSKNPEEGMSIDAAADFLYDFRNQNRYLKEESYREMTRGQPKKLTDTYIALDKRFEGDSEKIIKALTEKETIEEFELTIADAAKVIESAKERIQLNVLEGARATRVKKMFEEKAENLADEIEDLFTIKHANGTLTQVFIRDMATQYQGEIGKVLDPAITTRWIDKVMGVDSPIYNQVHTEIVTLNPHVTIGYINALPISDPKKDALVDKLDRTRIGFLNEAERDAEKLLTDAIFRRSEFGWPMPNPSGNLKMTKAKERLDKFELEFLASGLPWTEQTRQEYAKMVAGLVEEYRLVAAEAQEEMLEESKEHIRRMELLEKREKGPREKPKTIEEYEERLKNAR